MLPASRFDGPAPLGKGSAHHNGRIGLSPSSRRPPILSPLRGSPQMLESHATKAILATFLFLCFGLLLQQITCPGAILAVAPDADGEPAILPVLASQGRPLSGLAVCSLVRTLLIGGLRAYYRLPDTAILCCPVVPAA